MTENNEHIINRTAYSETKGTGVLVQLYLQ